MKKSLLATSFAVITANVLGMPFEKEGQSSSVNKNVVLLSLNMNTLQQAEKEHIEKKEKKIKNW